MPIFGNKPSYKDAAKPTVRKETVTVSRPKLNQATKSARPSPQPSLSSLKSKASSSSLPARTKPPRASGPPDPSTRFRSTPSSSSLRALADPASRTKSKSVSPYPPSSDEKSRKRKAPASPATPLWETETGSSSDDDDWDTMIANKRRRPNVSDRVDKTRVLRNERSFLFLKELAAAERANSLKPANGHTANGVKRDPLAKQRNSDNNFLKFRHAAELASLQLGCHPVLGAKREDVALELQYPGALVRERFELVSGRDKIEAAPQILQTVKHIAYSYLTPTEAEPFTNRKTGLIRRLEKAMNRGEADEFMSAVNDYNTQLLGLYTSGSISRNLSTTHNLPTEVTNFILDQVYDRAVAPKVEQLLKYENGTDYVYGELLHPFITEILTVRSTMTSESVFVDLGSGVGNVVLQAAIEIGCESWGCEMMPNACDLAEAQLVELMARKRLWGINTGEVHLERGDFRKNKPIMEALKRADVVLVNNQVFTAALNDDLVRMFLDLKSGCKIISLKSFVHEHKGSAHNANDVGRTILDVVDYTYPEGYVSWTGNGGNYCVSTRR